MDGQLILVSTLESAVVTVTDVIAYGEDIRTSFYEMSNRFLNSQTYMGNTSDYNGPYDVSEVQRLILVL